MHDKQLPLIGITIGDAAGIGPEVVAKAVQNPQVHQVCRPLIIGDARVFTETGLSAICPRVSICDSVLKASFSIDMLTVLNLNNLDPAEIKIGEVCPAAGKASVEYVLEGAKLAMNNSIQGLATAPLNKIAIRQAGYNYIGHTEILKEITKAKYCITMLASKNLRVTHVTRHIAFKEITKFITQNNILENIVITNREMKRLGYKKPRIAVAGLNPHNGDGGLFGREEIDEIQPAVLNAQKQGINVQGPISADIVFHAAIANNYDVIICMYHDQGHIAVKTYDFENSITITLGLPIIRTSANHGTAFDIAGKGIANESSMLAAIIEAARLSKVH
jgi:4-hydroxythreonine-4-phosphate dehydrogenase